MPNKTLCIIPARGGSKRITRKNIKDFCGKPIIAYSIETAISSGLFDEVMVSTDDIEIAEIAKQYGAKVPFMRSKKASDDHATTADVLLEVLEKYEIEFSKNFKHLCCMYACAPLIQQEAFQRAHQKIISEDLDTVFPITEYSTPIKRALRIDKDKRASFIFKENEQVRSQDLETTYFDVGQFYWLNTARFIKNKKIASANTKCIILPSIQTQDIDNEQDWKMAELKYQLLTNEVS